MIVTTSYNPTPALEADVRAFARKWRLPYERRERLSLQQLRARYNTDEIIILSKEKARWTNRTAEFSFHPSLSVVRIKRLIDGDTDVLKEAAALSEGDAFLDATLGFAADAITAAHIVGMSGRVVGLESDLRVAALVEYGLKHFPIDVPQVEQAMHRVCVKHTDHLTYLEQCPNNAYDVVYFDPMFRNEVRHSGPMQPLRELADVRPLSRDAVWHACRIARKRVVLKETPGSGEFERLGFQLIRTNSHTVAYGIIHAGENDET